MILNWTTCIKGFEFSKNRILKLRDMVALSTTGNQLIGYGPPAIHSAAGVGKPSLIGLCYLVRTVDRMF